MLLATEPEELREPNGGAADRMQPRVPGGRAATGRRHAPRGLRRPRRRGRRDRRRLARAASASPAYPIPDRRYDRVMRTTAELREGFLSYFESKGHLRRPSAPLIPPADDPSTLFIVAGMQPMKRWFLGLDEPPAKRIVTSQKVMRAGGKHADLDDVGSTARHASFFEMLGNFSFGDYFKSEAIPLAWEFVTEHMGFPPDRLWATVFAGDPELGLGEDDVAVQGWLDVGLPRERIVGQPRSENFWQAADTGPCGPCSEIFYDRGPEHGCGDPSVRAELRALRALPRVLEPRLHGVRPRRRRHADAAAAAEHRHRPRPRARRDAAAGRRLDLRHRRLPGDHALGGRGVRRRLRRLRAGDEGAPRPRRPRPRDGLPHLRGDHALERGPRLHRAAADPPRRAAGQPDRPARTSTGCRAS